MWGLNTTNLLKEKRFGARARFFSNLALSAVFFGAKGRCTGVALTPRCPEVPTRTFRPKKDAKCHVEVQGPFAPKKTLTTGIPERASCAPQGRTLSAVFFGAKGRCTGVALTPPRPEVPSATSTPSPRRRHNRPDFVPPKNPLIVVFVTKLGSDGPLVPFFGCVGLDCVAW